MYGVLRLIVFLAPATVLPCDCFVSSPVKYRPRRRPPTSQAAAISAAPHDDDANSSADASSVAAGDTILCKTVETFKLADLYHLEVSLKASLCGMSCDRLGIDPATGSSLLLLTEAEEPGEGGKPAHTNDEGLLAISSSKSIEWVGLELVSAFDAEGLVEELRDHTGEIESIMREKAHHIAADNMSAIDPPDITWTLEYTRMGGAADGGRNKAPHTSKTLCYGVANALTLPPELDAKSDMAPLNLVLLDGPDKIRLCLVMSRGENDGNSRSTADIVQKKWSGRPFQYSSAMNPTAASIIVDILFRMCQKDKVNGFPTLLDPTCGSGTFLAFALGNGANAIGWDINDRCCEGARRNLDFLRGAIMSEGMEPSSSHELAYQIVNQDAAKVPTDAWEGDEIDCAVANLPWGQNTPTYYQENNKILKALGGMLRSAVPVAIISRDSSAQKDLERNGYRVLGAASIPQSNFRLPKTSKKKKNKTKNRKEALAAEEEEDDDDDDQDRASICTVTIAVTD